MVGRKKNRRPDRFTFLAAVFNFPQAHSNSTSVARSCWYSSSCLIKVAIELIVLQEPLFCGGVNVSKPENSCFLKILFIKISFPSKPLFPAKKKKEEN